MPNHNKFIPHRTELLRDIWGIIRRYKQVGLVGINNDLKNADNAHKSAHVYVVQQAAAIYLTTPRKILKTRLRGKGGRITLARVSCIVIMHKHLKMTPTEIKNIMDRDLSLISHRLTSYYNNPKEDKIYCDKTFNTNFEILENITIKYLQNGRA